MMTGNLAGWFGLRLCLDGEGSSCRFVFDTICLKKILQF